MSLKKGKKHAWLVEIEIMYTLSSVEETWWRRASSSVGISCWQTWRRIPVASGANQIMASLFIPRRLIPTRISSVLCRKASSFFTEEYTPPQLDHVTADWDKLYQQSIRDPATFWGQLGATRLDWIKPFDKVMDVKMKIGWHKWFVGGKLNVSG